MMLLIDEPGTRRLFVNDMRGILYSVSYDGKSVAPYLDLRIARWSVNVLSVNFEQGIQSFAFHPQFATPGTPGFGKFYTYVDTSNIAPPPDFKTVVRSVRTIRSCSNGREGSRGRRIRWRAASGTPALAAVPESQRRPHQFSRWRHPGTPISACCARRLCGWRQRQRSVQCRSGSELGVQQNSRIDPLGKNNTNGK